MTFQTTVLQFTFVAAAGLAGSGCQSMAATMDDPLAYDSAVAQPTSLNAYCSQTARDAAVWGTLPSAWCAPYGPGYWSRSTGPGPSYYGRSYGRTWRGPGWGHYRGYPGRGYGGGWRGGRGGRR